MNGWDDITRDELRAEDRAERARYRLHWCRDCLGMRGGPCDQEPDAEPAELEEENEQ